MITTWQNITQSMGFDMWMQVQQILAQSPTQMLDRTANQSVGVVQNTIQQALAFLPQILGAILILIVGWLIAAIASSVVRGVLSRTKIDNRIAQGITGSDAPQVEKLISGVVFWVIFLFTIVAVLDTLKLRVASQPLNSFLGQIGEFLPKLLGVAIWLGIAWLLATVVKMITVRGLQTLNIDERLNAAPQDSVPSLNQLSLSDTIGNALYWFIFLVFLVPILDTLGLRNALVPVQTLITQIVSILPNILGASIIAIVGWFVANVVRRIVTNLLATTGIDHLGSRFGISRASGAQSLSTILGTVVYVLILIPVAIAALNTLKIDAISVPAVAMLQQILNALPLIFTAFAIWTVSYFVGRFVAELVTSILTSIGFNNIFSILGLSSLSAPSTISSETTTSKVPTRTPSEIAGLITLVGIMLFATVAAVDILGIPTLTALVSSILLVLGQILAGLVVFGIGLYFANLAFRIITISDSPQARILGQAARISIIILVSAMALQRIGVAPDIVNLAFGLLLGAIAVAIALAFGLGGRDIARVQVQEWLDSFKARK